MAIEQADPGGVSWTKPSYQLATAADAYLGEHRLQVVLHRWERLIAALL
jgi:hypothetical protein